MLGSWNAISWNATPHAAPSGGGGACGAPINFGDFDDKGWVRFQAELLQLIDESILSGRWRQASSREAMAGGAAMSCPRF